MLDILFAMIAAGANAAGPDQGAASAQGAQTAVTQRPEVIAQDQGATQPSQAGSATVQIGENVTLGQNVQIGGAALLEGTADVAAPAATAPAAPETVRFDMSVVPAGLVAEPQIPSGKFTTAAEVKPILDATKGNWVAVREYDGKDLLYVTHLWGWRCGLSALAIGVNNEPLQNWPLPPCHMKYTTPNAILEDDGLPYLSLRLGGVETIDIQIVYDDLSMDRVQFERGNVLIP